MYLVLLLAVLAYLLTRDVLHHVGVRWRRDPLRLTAPLGHLQLVLATGFAVLAVVQAFEGDFLFAAICAFCAASDVYHWRTSGARRLEAVNR